MLIFSPSLPALLRFIGVLHPVALSITNKSWFATLVMLAVISLSKQKNTLRVSCLICVENSCFQNVFWIFNSLLGVECFHDVVFLSLYTNCIQYNSVVGALHKSLALSFHQKRAGCNSAILAVAQVCEFLLCVSGYCIWCFLGKKKIKGVLELGNIQTSVL